MNKAKLNQETLTQRRLAMLLLLQNGAKTFTDFNEPVQVGEASIKRVPHKKDGINRLMAEALFVDFSGEDATTGLRIKKTVRAVIPDTDEPGKLLVFCDIGTAITNGGMVDQERLDKALELLPKEVVEALGALSEIPDAETV